MQHRILAAAALAAVLAGCQGSGRFSDFGGSPPQAAVVSRPPQLTPAPTSPVQSTPLPPIGGPPQTAPSAGLPPIGSTVPIETPDGGQPRSTARPQPPIDPPPAAPAPEQRPPQVAARPEPAAPSGPPTRTAVTGNWTAREAAGGSCKVTLSSAPTLDLYKASSSGCQSKELQRVNAWELRGDEVYLYEPGGGVAARLKKTGGNFEGSAARTGAPITLSK
jgi:hypothetical protein